MTVSISSIYTPYISFNPLFVPSPISKYPKTKLLCHSIICFSSPPDMDAAGPTSLYPLHRSKTIHLVRHAQGFTM
ncbi:hypothetical protein M0R45_027164 [Rubus argutus]|uniref:Phosphoglycerate mutase n=1 Tax=Rubus argutus TaxID=59490 RepID=A0AAW1X1A7_RUBAR